MIIKHRPLHSVSTTLALATALLLPATDGLSAESTFVEETRSWRQEREDRLRSEEGWLTLVGLYWLTEGENSLGAAPDSVVVLPADKAPHRAGTITLDHGVATLESRSRSGLTHGGESFETLTLSPDSSGEPTVVERGDLLFYLIERDGEFGVRVKDRKSRIRMEFTGLDWFAADEAWRVKGRFRPYDPPRQIPIASVLGTVTQQPSSGAIEFSRDGETFRLDVLAEPGDSSFFVIFKDETSGRETYGAGRYLSVDAPDGTDSVTIDFNRAYNPPCAFTAWATCPLPPRQNRLAMRVTAGEKAYNSGSGDLEH